MHTPYTPESYTDLRAAIRELCSNFPNAYWRALDKTRQYPEAFVQHLTASGYLAALIPKEYGGLGLGLTEASVILEEIQRSGGHSAACHAQMYTMGALLRHGSAAQKERYLPELAVGRLRLQAFSVTEPEAGSDTTSIRTFARRDATGYVVTGHKNWTSRVEQSDLLMLLARTTPRDDVPKATDGLSLFLIDLRDVRAQQPDALEVIPVRTMFNYATYQLKYHQMRIP
ncbi:MAG: acyl-CoA/acyl-ACP dehydrogenase, partial [Caldilineaceae bacterium]|nr:acyl-CoA/acyl-ACP dehydrogenase [Caldilineaceae bacterium]